MAKGINAAGMVKVTGKQRRKGNKGEGKMQKVKVGERGEGREVEGEGRG